MSAEGLPPAAPDLGALLTPLVAAGVDFVVIGGMAGVAHGSSYPSFDLDVAYSRERANLERLVEVLRGLDVTLRGAPANLPFQLDVRSLENGANFTCSTRHGDFDVLADVAGIKSYRELRQGADLKSIAGVEVPVASIDHLIAMKRASNRPKDRNMLEEYIVLAEEQRRLDAAAQAE